MLTIDSYEDGYRVARLIANTQVKEYWNRDRWDCSGQVFCTLAAADFQRRQLEVEAAAFVKGKWIKKKIKTKLFGTPR